MTKHLLGLSDRQASYGNAREIHRANCLRALDPEVLIEAALHYSEQVPAEGTAGEIQKAVTPDNGTFCPQMRDIHGVQGLLPGDSRRAAHIEHHRDIRSDHLLDVNHLFRREYVPGAVDMALELHALLMYLPELAQGEYLKAAAVGEDVAVPVAEVMKPVKGLEDLNTRAKVKMVCVSEYQVVTDLGDIVMMDAFHGAVGSHGHERGCLDHSVREIDFSGSGLAVSVPVMLFVYYLLHIFTQLITAFS